MKRYPHYLTAWMFCAILCGCASLGITPAKTFTQRVAYAYGTTTGLREAATHSLEAKTLASADGAYVLKVADETRTLLDAAQAATQVGDTQTGEARLVLALQMLETLQAYLDKKVAK